MILQRSSVLQEILRGIISCLTKQHQESLKTMTGFQVVVKTASKKNIDRKRSQRPDCFTSEDQSICGNKIVEKGEQCDCGDKATCKEIENCCIPAGEANQCTLPVQHQCSPSQGMYQSQCSF